jgi:hypothetical protein
MEFSLSWEATNCLVTEEFSNVLWNPEVRYRLYKSSSRVPIQSQINPIHTTQSYFSDIRFYYYPATYV